MDCRVESMALKTDLNPNEIYDSSGIIKSGQVMLYDRSLMFYSRDISQDECSIVLNPAQHQNLDLPEIVLDGDYFQFDSVPSMRPNHQSGQDLTVLEILYNNDQVPDQPEFVDVDQLTDLDTLEPATATSTISSAIHEENEKDDDDDVIFVKEYKHNEIIKEETGRQVEFGSSYSRSNQVNLPKVRRNPVRTTRNKSRDFSMEVLYEEDFAFLDSTDDEDDFKENKPSKKNCDNLELPKEWPIDVHERPEYNYKTQQIESFDFTIREIQKKVPPKKPRLETVPIRRKSNKKYLSRKKKPKAVVEKKTPLKDLQPLVKSTNALLRDFFRSLRDDRHLIKRDKNNLHERVQILRNQAMLSSLVNGDQVDEALKNLDRCFKE
ncbi:unnamed protein product [Acanthoscelides obtectus]|uniref:Uncharacterized protein n=2 Tax=Acanthoscelides obtectus TaxID=200917 RepID=A0A9P0MG75_ACAOB|nr:unnamed protein product [Acanthoscelides obtectus]